MNIVMLEFKKCCECEARATKKLELLECDERGVVGPSDPKHYCDTHFPKVMDEDQLRLLLDVRNDEIERLLKNLKGRDDFLVAKGLWSEFVDQLPRSNEQEAVEK